jgi:hypothetical protein
MSSPIIGRLTSMHVISGRSDIVVLAVNANARSGSFDVLIPQVTLNGVVAKGLDEILAFVVGYRRIGAEVTEPEWEQAGTGYIPCASIALTALE